MSRDEISRTNNRNRQQNQSNSKGKSKKKKKFLTKKRVLWSLFFAMALAIFCALGGYLFIMLNGQKLLNENQDKLTVNPPTQIFDRNANLIGELSLEKSDPVEYEDIPEQVVNAFVATEDKRFFEHKGVDFWSIGRAAVKDIAARSMVEGGSTITQQLAKNIFLTRDKTFFRKATEVSIAVALENTKTKPEIITMYLNRIPFGGTVYGIKAASIRYFGKSNLKDLELWQIATLAAMPKGPSRYNPLRNPELSKERRGVVLQLMYDQGYITKEQMDEAKVVDYNYKPPESKQRYQAFIDFAIDEAEEKFGLTEDDLNIGGYKIYTTMDKHAQETVEDAFADKDNFEESVDDELVQGSMTIINQENGSIVALMGGRNYEKKGFSRVNGSRRSPGSSFKPIVSYAPALESGKFTSESMLSNEKQCFGTYCPNNLHGYSSTISMSAAITKSENIPAVWLLNEIGVNTGFQFAKKLGINLSDDDKNLSLALGGMSKGTNTLEMAQAYSSFANGGELRGAYSIKSIANSDGETVYKANTTPERVMSENTAYQMTQMMQEVVTDGTGKKAKINRPVAGKTGTTQSGYEGISSNRDVWFVGYTPEWTAAVWMGYDKPNKTHLLKNSSPLAAAFWGKVMEEALEGVPSKSFPTPEGAVKTEPTATPETVQPVNGLTAAYDPSTMTVNLSWEPAQTEGVEYRIYRRETSEADYSQLLNTMSSSVGDISAMPGLTYEYYVTAYYPELDTESEPSGAVTVAVQDEAPTTEPEPTLDPNQPTDNPGNGENNGNGNGAGNGVPGGNNGNGNGNGNGGGNGNGNGAGNGAGNGGAPTNSPESTTTPPPATLAPTATPVVTPGSGNAGPDDSTEAGTDPAAPL
ncbi:Biosynthetic peptidoglycan transglycosylase [Paenibacillus auburnensis]|uniref:Biosynthetic peptidoglycan transglycosylase n=1 Tax=Paenibacillus auburnensis TaxID=2905649 RepID=A0ABN8FXS7_9BACL|nr:PBP1A family penicillin-binding protein [Paenibacillus auburnensis]CAH1192658.1 Biosynthetic peptidoglycan transglycosylase [Paenibacillus auburnensis]